MLIANFKPVKQIGEVMGVKCKDQELFTRSVFESIAHSGGFRFDYSQTDDGVDASVYYLMELSAGDRRRFLRSPQSLYLQHKSTSSSALKTSSNCIRYALEAKTYNDMIQYRRHNNNLVLILSVITKDAWVECCDDHQRFFSNAFWYMIPNNAVETTNSSSVTVDIPLVNKFTQNTLNDLFNLLHKSELLNDDSN